MNLKEAYQYQNYIGTLFGNAVSYLSSEAYVTNTVRTHYKSRASAADDETTIETVARPFGSVPVSTLAAFACALVKEREELGVAISNAKHLASVGVWEDGVELDAQLAANKFRHTLIGAFDTMLKIKPEVTRKSCIRDYTFNAEGNQTPYYYPAEDVVTIDFDRNKLRESVKLLKQQADNVSFAADKAMLTTAVNFTPSFDIADSFDDALAAYVDSVKK